MPTDPEKLSSSLRSDFKNPWQNELSELMESCSKQSEVFVREEGLSAILDSVAHHELAPNLLVLVRDPRFSSFAKQAIPNVDGLQGFWLSLFRNLIDWESAPDISDFSSPFQQAIDQGRNPGDWKVILEILVQCRQWGPTCDLAKRILEVDAVCPQSRLLLARALRNLNEYESSIKQWNKLLEMHPNEPELYGELGNTYFAARQFSEANQAYRKVVEKNPEDLSARLSLFAAAHELKDKDAMDETFQEALSIANVSSIDFESAVKSMMYQVESEWTLKLIERWLELYPDQPVASHLKNSLESGQPKESTSEVSAAYIEAEFDEFAESFETRLKLLGYRGPQALHELLDELSADRKFDEVLDAGCGTGWCGSGLRERATRLTGVDLSGAMLEQARSKSVYDDLYQADLNKHLQAYPSGYELVVALDTLIYMSQLSVVFGKLYESLKPGGLAVFNLELLEENEQEGVKLQRNGRFAHSLAEIEKAIGENAWRPLMFERRVLRIENGNPVYHVMVALDRGASDKEEAEPQPPVYRDKSVGDRIEIYQTVVRNEPRSGTAHFQLGNALLAAGKLDEARQCFEMALSLESDASTLCNLGNAYAQMGKLNDALLSFEKALQLEPDFVPALNNAGRASFELGRHSEAMTHLRRALRLQPKNSKSHVFLGNLLLSQGDGNAAIQSYQEAIECDPNQPEVHLLLGNILLEQHKLSAAAASYVQSQQLTPQNPFVYDALGTVNHLRGQLTEASFCFLQALQLSSGDPRIHSHMIFNMIHDFTVPLGDLVTESKGWAKRMRLGFGGPDSEHSQKLAREPDKKLTMGFVHPNVSEEPICELLDQLQTYVDTEQFRLFYYTGLTTDGTFVDSKKSAGWNLTRLDFNDFESLERQIQAHEIDVLIDLAGHSLGNCLPLYFKRPAPLQMIWPVQCEPTAMSEFDCIIGDSSVLTKENQNVYSESAALLEGPMQPLSAPATLPEPRQTITTEPADIVLGCLASLPCLSADVISTWGQILIELPSANLLLGSRSLGDPSIQRRILEVFSKMGVPEQRVRFKAVESKEQQLEFWKAVDVGLDTFPVNSPRDVFLALLMGCPVITLAGMGIQERTTKSLFSNASLADFVTYNKTDYIAEVVKIAGDEHRREEYLQALRDQILQSANCDNSAFVLNFEKLMRQKWKAKCQ